MTRFVHPADSVCWKPLLWRCLVVCRSLQLPPTRQLLLVSVTRQRLWWLAKVAGKEFNKAGYTPLQAFLVSTSRFGVGQVANTNHTPLGLHCIADKIGAGWPIGTVFAERRPVGYCWQGHPHARIVHRILRLQGLQPGFNSGGDCDSYNRAIYIHGVSDETKLGRPNSHGCIHLGNRNLIFLFDRIKLGTMVWIDRF